MLAPLGASVLMLLLCQICSAQTQNWIHVKQSDHGRIECEVHLLPGTSFDDPAHTKNILEAHPSVEAAKLNGDSRTLELYVNGLANVEEVNHLLEMFDIPVDHDWFAMHPAAQHEREEAFLPVLINRENNVHTYMVDLPYNLDEHQQSLVAKQLLAKELVREANFTNPQRLQLRVKDRFNENMVKEVLMASLN